MKVIIAGGRDFNDYEFLKQVCSKLSELDSEIEIVSGGAKGADALGERFANEMGYALKVFPADWSEGRKAGPIRNSQMANYADALIAFWDGKSKGTKNMIDLATKRGLGVKVVYI